jgi:ABC-2 type transport system ATP-binding protein
MPSPILSVNDLRKVYGTTTAVDGISFDVRPNEIVGLLGPNGAGKTTTINIILGALESSGGAVRIENFDIATHRREALARTNFAAVYAPLPGNLTVEQNLRIFGMLYDVQDLQRRIDALLEEFGLARFRRTKAGLLSSGEMSRLGVAKAMLNRPHLLLLDEPTASLDPSVAQSIREQIRAFAANSPSGVLWTSHNMNEVETVCHRVLFLAGGKILLEGNPKTLPREHGKNSLEELFIAVAREPLTFGGAE